MIAGGETPTKAPACNLLREGHLRLEVLAGEHSRVPTPSSRSPGSFSTGASLQGVGAWCDSVTGVGTIVRRQGHDG